MDKVKVEDYMRQTGLKKALIRCQGKYYLCEAKTEHTAWENRPYDAISITPLPPPIELI